MQVKQTAVLQKFKDVQEFLNAHAAALPEARLAPLRAVLDEAVKEITAFAADQLSKGVQTLQAKTLVASKTNLRDGHLRPLSDIAKHALPDTQAIRTAFKLPPSKANLAKLLASAKAMGDNAQTYQSAFVQQGQPADFLAQLQAAVDAVNVDANAKSGAKRLRRGATAGIKAQILAGRSAVTRMEGQMIASFAKADPLLLAWKEVSKGARSHGIMAKQVVAGTAPLASTTTSTPSTPSTTTPAVSAPSATTPVAAAPSSSTPAAATPSSTTPSAAAAPGNTTTAAPTAAPATATTPTTSTPAAPVTPPAA